MRDRGKITSVTIGDYTYHLKDNINEIAEGKCDVTIHFDAEKIKKYREKQREKLLNNSTIEWIEIKQSEDEQRG